MKTGVKLHFSIATDADAESIASLRTAVAERLTQIHGPGPWSWKVTAKGVRYSLRASRVLVARDGDDIVGTLNLATKKPWAIDVAYFTAVPKSLYLTAMAVAADRQRTGIGRSLIEQAQAMARTWPADAIRLDAYDANAGAGEFYAKCGFRKVGRVTYRGTPLIYFEALL